MRPDKTILRIDDPREQEEATLRYWQSLPLGERLLRRLFCATNSAARSEGHAWCSAASYPNRNHSVRTAALRR